MIDLYILIFFMAVITFACRYLFFSRTIPIRLGPRAKAVLSYAGPSVLTAMWVPIVFFGHGTIGESLITSPFLYAGLITVFASLLLKNTLLIVGAGTISFLAFNFFI